MASVYPEHRSVYPDSLSTSSAASAAGRTGVYRPDAPTPILLRQSELEPGEFERPELEAVEIVGMWGGTILFARHISPSAEFVIGEGSKKQLVDFAVSAAELGASSARLVASENGAPHVAVPRGARASVKQWSDANFAPTSASSVPLHSGAIVELSLGRLTFRIANVPLGKGTPRAGLSGVETGVLWAFGVAFGVAAALLASFAFWMPAMGLNDGEDLEAERLYTIKQYASTNAQRDREEEAEKHRFVEKNANLGAPAQAAAEREGTLGKLNSPVTQRRWSARVAAPTSELSRAQLIDTAQSFGMIDLLGSSSSAAFGTSSPFARNAALGHADGNAQGNLFGDTIGESGGNGLRLSGLDNGGGGHGLGVSLGGIGTCRPENCGRSGFAKDLGRIGGRHESGAPRVTPAGLTQVSGRLPKEVVQRIVRQNFGRFRLCYENGLRTNPNLTGRVSARFVIGREGNVSNVRSGGSDIPDAGVVSCVVQAFYGLSFPTPENGIVSVSYPISFSPG